MKIKSNLLAFAAISLLSACAPEFPRPDLNDVLIGCWSGEDYQPVLQRKAKWLMNRKPDGTFSIHFSVNERGVDLPVQTEQGIWTHKAGLYTTKTLIVAGEKAEADDPHYTDTYEVKSLDDGVLTYYHPKMKITFTSKRVACERGAA